MQIKILNDDIKKPASSYAFDAGIDVFAPTSTIIEPGKVKQIKLGFAIEIMNNEVIVMSERSSQAIAFGITSIGNIIDAGYRGEVSIILFNSGEHTYCINKGDKIGQMLVLQLGDRKVEVVETLSDSDRGTNNHGSSGK